VHWGIVKEDLGALVQLLTQLLKTFNNNWRVDFPFYYRRDSLIVPFKKTEHIHPATMTRRWYGNDFTDRLPCVWDTGG
jgi:hypothetical protein